MANKIFIRLGSWYRATEKFFSADIDISPLIENVDAEYPVIKDDAGGGGATPTLDQVLAAGSTLIEDRTINLNAKSLLISSGVSELLLLNPAQFSASLKGTDGIAQGLLQLIGDGDGDNIQFDLSASNGDDITVQVKGDAVANTLLLVANAYRFNSLAGGGITGASIDDNGNLIRTP